jgi:hypothetical protein
MKSLKLLLTTLLVSAVFLCSCGPDKGRSPEPVAPQNTDSRTETAPVRDTTKATAVYANTRFRNVQVTKTGAGEYQVTGEAQVFEAAFSWVVEDGHDELLEGHETTDAGAPAWGKFRFTVAPKKQNPNNRLHLILFEYSAKDGSRQYELPIPLP